MHLLLVSIAVLWLAPWLHRLIGRSPTAARWTQRGLVVLVMVLVLGTILPDSIRLVGWWAILLVAVGTLVPSLIERAWHRLAAQVHWIPLVVGIVGLALHASLDGAAFVDPDAHRGHDHLHALPIAVVVHRFFEGLFLWLFLRPRMGVRVALGGLTLISLFSVLGYWAGDFYFHSLEQATAFGVFQAIVAGSLLHLVMDPHDPGQLHDHAHHGGHAHGSVHAHESGQSHEPVLGHGPRH